MPTFADIFVLLCKILCRLKVIFPLLAEGTSYPNVSRECIKFLIYKCLSVEGTNNKETYSRSASQTAWGRIHSVTKTSLWKRKEKRQRIYLICYLCCWKVGHWLCWCGRR
ncbi:hypothetical protein Y032_0156g3149 [Ancylostoma ceylanicum]|uniref:Secreted protein n=1 Tax=Ancylostoma ceylanicum TaxID=53326 RepID=A0A016SZB2_9BILA|nr:hypothetical protein Y032_0156g3149 [Ancylostoma ceylanicum]